MSANSNDMDNEANRLFLVWKEIVENRPLKINHKINPEEVYNPRDAFFSVLKGDRPLASIQGGLTLVEKKALSKLVDSKTLGLLEYDSPCPSIDIKHMDVYRIGYEDEARMLMNITITNNLRALKEEALGGSKTSQKIMSYDRILNTCEAYGKLYRYKGCQKESRNPSFSVLKPHGSETSIHWKIKNKLYSDHINKQVYLS